MSFKVDQINNIKTKNFIMCGGGRKNKTLIKKVEQLMNNKKLTIKNDKSLLILL